ncbi:PspC domain-containing protein [Paenibacillus sp. TRM 82003]|uniref:PspC domain-containing protein n=1 Tax=Kineococcus sp. TRM81007 TaxID=2925831 RepID=UPI001F5728EC|nr:PspC domain-containing protein [Kineococcus sp. TRM81007]MCI2237971.1 PspC domain-containing protein [Kineococcus sp. TRM81007]MCI3925986.1 PspC domain-containing protein [Paenibacillus sp. TRM 82003]
MSTPDPGRGGQRDTGKLARATELVRSWGVVRGRDRWFAGVCGGVAARLGVDPVLLRGLLVALVLVGGLGLALYGIAWAVLPDERGRVELEAAARGDVSGGFALSAALVLLDLAVGGLAGPAFGPLGGNTGWGFLVTSLVAALLWWLFHDHLVAAWARRPQREEAPAPAPEPAAAAAATVSLRKAPPPGPVVEPVEPVGPVAGFGSATERSAAAREKALAAVERRTAARGSGSPLLTTVALGVAMLAAGAVVLADLLVVLPAPAPVLALTAALAVVGAGAVAAGLAGRRTALVGFGVPLAVWTVLAGTLPPVGGWQWDANSTWTPTAASVREQAAFSSAVGRMRVDPSGLVPAGGEPVPVTATLAAGRLEVVVPEDRTVLVDARALAGSLRWDAAGDVAPVASGDRALVATGASGEGTGREGGLDTRLVLAAGPDAGRVAATTEVTGDDVADWTVPDGVAVVRAVVWGGEVRVGADGSELLEGS